MTARTVTMSVIMCDGLPDGPGAPPCAAGADDMVVSPSPTAIRAKLRKEGWHRTKDGRDLCPDCWASGQR